MTKNRLLKQRNIFKFFMEQQKLHLKMGSIIPMKSQKRLAKRMVWAGVVHFLKCNFHNFCTFWQFSAIFWRKMKIYFRKLSHTPFEPDPVSKKTTRDLAGMAMSTILGSIKNTKFENPMSTITSRRAFNAALYSI